VEVIEFTIYNYNYIIVIQSIIIHSTIFIYIIIHGKRIPPTNSLKGSNRSPTVVHTKPQNQCAAAVGHTNLATMTSLTSNALHIKSCIQHSGRLCPTMPALVMQHSAISLITPQWHSMQHSGAAFSMQHAASIIHHSTLLQPAEPTTCNLASSTQHSGPFCPTVSLSWNSVLIMKQCPYHETVSL